jgi:hypothetical protein
LNFKKFKKYCKKIKFRPPYKEICFVIAISMCCNLN